MLLTNLQCTSMITHAQVDRTVRKQNTSGTVVTAGGRVPRCSVLASPVSERYGLPLQRLLRGEEILNVCNNYLTAGLISERNVRMQVETILRIVFNFHVRRATEAKREQISSGK